MAAAVCRGVVRVLVYWWRRGERAAVAAAVGVPWRCRGGGGRGISAVAAVVLAQQRSSRDNGSGRRMAAVAARRLQRQRLAWRPRAARRWRPLC